MPNSMIKPIPTIYKDTPFRSRCEARWAVCLDELHIPWRYEVEGYELNGYWYLPDFYLPGFFSGGDSLWLEVKGQSPTLIEFIKATMLAEVHRADMVVLTWEYFSHGTTSDNIGLWHDEQGVFHSQRGVDWLPLAERGWRAAKLAQFGRAPLLGDWQPETECGELPF